MVETFNKNEFEQALPNTSNFKWKYEGFLNKEHCYSIPADKESKSKVFIRSSIGTNNLSANCGKDSIRCYLVDSKGNPLGSKISKYTTRIKGWESRMKDVIRELIILRGKSGNDENGNPRAILKVKKDGPNKGRFFSPATPKMEYLWLD